MPVISVSLNETFPFKFSEMISSIYSDLNDWGSYSFMSIKCESHFNYLYDEGGSKSWSIFSNSKT